MVLPRGWRRMGVEFDTFLMIGNEIRLSVSTFDGVCGA